MKNILSGFLFSILILGCTSPADPYTYKEEIVVKAILYVGEGIDSIKLTRTVPLDQAYDNSASSVNNASVKIQSETGEFAALKYLQGKSGCYGDSTFIIKPNTTYFLTIDVPGFDQITGQTTTPGNFTLISQNAVSFSYSDDAFGKDSLIVNWNEVENNHYYLVSTTYIGPDSSAVEISKKDDKETGTKEELKTRAAFTTRTWFRMIGFLHKYFGSYRVTVTAMDKNLFDYIRTQNQDDRELNEPIFSVKNGIGYFASGSRKKGFYEVLK